MAKDRSSGAPGLYTLTPYRAGRIPVVLVHGTASSPARWADLVNELDSDPRIGRRCQFWVFEYNTGNPLLYSAGLLGQTLEQTVAELDPAGADAALRRMVVIGHSQGGLLTKLMAVDTGSRFWDDFSQTPLEALRVSEETRTILRRSLYFTRAPSSRGSSSWRRHTGAAAWRGSSWHGYAGSCDGPSRSRPTSSGPPWSCWRGARIP